MYKKYIRETPTFNSSVGLTHARPNHIGMIITERSTMLHDNLPSTACIYQIFHPECDIHVPSCAYTINPKGLLYYVKYKVSHNTNS